MDKKINLFFAVMDIILGLINLALYFVHYRPMSMFAAGFCIAYGICLGIERLWVDKEG